MSCDGYWFASVFCTQMLFCHWGKELIPQTNETLAKRGNIEMSMSLWHQHVVAPTTKHVAEKHVIPTFARKALKIKTSLGDLNGAITLHVALLINAWKEMIQHCQRTSVGEKTLEEVKKWVGLMYETAQSNLFNAAPSRLKDKFHELFNAKLPSKNDSRGKQEHPYFSHEILYLRIAHMVFLYCKNTLESGFTNSKHATIKVTHSHMETWESFSGVLFRDLFSLEHGVPETDHFEFLKLPKEQFADAIGSNVSPSVAHLHVVVLHAIHKVVQENLAVSLRADWESEAPILEMCFPFAKTQFDVVYKKVFFNRRKQRNHYMKNRNPNKVYKPKQRYFFLRDRFIMGETSYYWATRTHAGRAAGEFQFVYPHIEDSRGQEESELSSDDLPEVTI